MLTVLPCAAALSVAPPVRAAGDDRAAAEALFAKGRDAAKRGDLDAACGAFEESERLQPAPGTMFNLGDCEEKRNHLAASWQWFEETLAKLPPADERRPLVQKRIAALEARLPTLSIKLSPGASAGAVVTRDSVELRAASLGVALPLDTGIHHIAVTAPGHDESKQDIVLAEGDRRELVVEPGPETKAVTPPLGAPVPKTEAVPPTPTPAPPPPAPPEHADTRMVGYVVAGIGVAGIGTALALGAVAIGKSNTVHDHCIKSANTCDSPSAVDAASSGSTIATASTVTFILGAAAVGVGAYFILTSGPSSETSLHATAGVGSASLRLTHVF
ncbi:MAG TPA: hypothetical protein VH062_30190 [Polyangiaceae bacterium]|jgi:hypothetical protein|nr:hypothetical protein [Polyangiaceae bacterium]